MDLLCSLPQELIDQIFAWLWLLDDRRLRSLKCCSLVSKSWRISCGHHLFRNLTLDSRNIGKFLALSESPDSFSTLFSRVKRLKVSEYWLVYYSAWVVEYSAEMHRFSSLDSLCLLGIIWNDPTGLIDFVRGFQNLHDLEIDENTFHSVGVFFKAIDYLTSLDRLSFRKIEFKDSSNVSHHLSGHPESHLRTLQFSEGSQDVLFNWLGFLGQKSLANITELCVLDIKEHYVQSFGQVILTLGPSIHHLEIGFYMHRTFAVKEASFCRHVDLSRNYNLRSLQVNTTQFYPQRSTYMDSDTYFPVHGIIPIIISQIHPSTPLEHLAFGAHVFGLRNNALWSRIRYLVERSELLGLKEMAFDLYPAPVEDFAGWQRYIRMHLRDYEAQGILRIRSVKTRVEGKPSTLPSE